MRVLWVRPVLGSVTSTASLPGRSPPWPGSPRGRAAALSGSFLFLQQRGRGGRRRRKRKGQGPGPGRLQRGRRRRWCGRGGAAREAAPAAGGARSHRVTAPGKPLPPDPPPAGRTRRQEEEEKEEEGGRLLAASCVFGPFPAQPRPLFSRTGAAAGGEAAAAPELPAGAPRQAWAAVSGLGCPDMKVSGAGRPGRSRQRRWSPARRPWGPIIIMAPPGAGPGARRRKEGEARAGGPRSAVS